MMTMMTMGAEQGGSAHKGQVKIMVLMAMIMLFLMMIRKV